MKKAILYGAIVIFIGICWLLIFKKQGEQPNISPQKNAFSTTGNSQQPTDTSVPSAGATPQQAVQTVSPVESQQQNNSLGTVSDTWSNQVQRSIEFYGKVVDESGQPVEGASVSFVCSQPVSEQSIETNSVSDANGLFSVVGLTGSTLGVHVQKDGYYSVKTDPMQFQYWKVLDSAPFQPDAGNPVVFHLRKKGAGVDLISSVLNVKIPLDGTPVNVDFLNRNFGAGGQLRLSQVKPPYESWKQANAWSFKMEIPDGGFVEQNDEFPFDAPESGYQPAIEFDFNAGQSDWKTYFTKSYYVVFGSPPQYGRLTIETDISWAGARITYSVNPDGSRNLEPK